MASHPLTSLPFLPLLEFQFFSCFYNQPHLNLVPTWLTAGGIAQAQSHLLMTLLTDGFSRGQWPSFNSTASGQLEWSLQGPQPFWNNGSHKSFLTVTSLGRCKVASCSPSPHYYFWDNYQCVGEIWDLFLNRGLLFQDTDEALKGASGRTE